MGYRFKFSHVLAPAIAGLLVLEVAAARSFIEIIRLPPVKHSADMQRLVTLFQANGVSTQLKDQQHVVKGAKLSGIWGGVPVTVLLNCEDEVFKVSGALKAVEKAALENGLKHSCRPEHPGAQPDILAALDRISPL